MCFGARRFYYGILLSPTLEIAALSCFSSEIAGVSAVEKLYVDGDTSRGLGGC